MNKLWDIARGTFLSRAVLLRSIPVGIVIAAGVVATSWTHHLLTDHQSLVVHTYEVINTTKDVLIGLDDAETGERGYLLSGDNRYLDPYVKALTRLTHLRADLGNLISDNADQRKRVDDLNHLIDEKLSQLKASIAVHDATGAETARNLEIANMQTDTMDDIRHIIGAITDTEKALLSSRQIEVEADEFRINLVALIVALGSFITRLVIELYLARSK